MSEASITERLTRLREQFAQLDATLPSSPNAQVPDMGFHNWDQWNNWRNWSNPPQVSQPIRLDSTAGQSQIG